MCLAGGHGARIDVARVPRELLMSGPAHLCFSESNSRFLCEVPTNDLARVPHAMIGEVLEHPRLTIQLNDEALIDVDIVKLKDAWQAPFHW
jgi:phosphoribosylformylglycinamidine synthase